MIVGDKDSFKLNPLTKLGVTIALGFTVLNPLSNLASFAMVITMALIFCLEGEYKESIRSLFFYVILWNFLSIKELSGLSPVLKIFLSFFYIAKIFYLPFLAGKYFIKTSDVGSIISSMDLLKLPQSLSIPLAVMFRFFPSFKEERESIKLAMRVRGISLRNPLVYFEYVLVPLLVLSSNITDDIAKAAETKGIGDPCPKVRYRKVGFGFEDGLYLVSVLLILGVDFLWLA